jgi:antitoxin (DNA-binding transcriptional repressor) of toxin-antitoxin stability system
MRFTPSVTDVARNFAEYINRVAFRGEHFILMRGKQPVAELRPVPAGRRLRELPGILASLPRLSASEVDDFAGDLDRAREELDRVPPHDPWAS